MHLPSWLRLSFLFLFFIMFYYFSLFYFFIKKNSGFNTTQKHKIQNPWIKFLKLFLLKEKIAPCAHLSRHDFHLIDSADPAPWNSKVKICVCFLGMFLLCRWQALSFTQNFRYHSKNTHDDLYGYMAQSPSIKVKNAACACFKIRYNPEFFLKNWNLKNLIQRVHLLE